MSTAVPFPEQLPKGYDWFDDEVPFDPAVHLALEQPEDRIMLSDLGYSEEEISTKATPFAASSAFRVLSDEGAEVMLDVARRLRPFCGRAGNRIERMTRGGCFRSRWLRDLCISPEVTEHLAGIYGIDIAPHPINAHLGHINYDPSEIKVSIDKWHHDTLPLDFVLMVTDPSTVEGGEFEYFTGTRQEAAALSALGQEPPEDRRTRPHFPGAGWAIALHGDMVVHRAAPLHELAERITMVNGYVSMDRSRDEQNRSRDLIAVDDHEALWTDWAKFVAWRSHGRLGSLLNELQFTSDRDAVIEELRFAVAEVNTAIEEMEIEQPMVSYYTTTSSTSAPS